MVVISFIPSVYPHGPRPAWPPITVHAASLDQMRAWTTRAAIAETLDKVFG